MVKQGQGHTRVYGFREEPSELRTSESFFQCAVEASNTGIPVKGVKNVSSLQGLAWFDMVNGLVPDYMHGILLGITKKILNLLLASCNSKKSYFIGHQIKLLDKRLAKMQPSDQISRLPWRMEKNLGHNKASEFQMWLLFYALPCLTGILKEEYFNHLALLIEGIYILLGDNITPANLERTSSALSQFYEDFSKLYGINNCSLNVHNVCHLARYVKNLGPLWAWSCFPFESMNGNKLAGVHGTGDVCQQILWSIQAVKRLDVDARHISMPSVHKYLSAITGVGQKIKVTADAQNCKIAGARLPHVPTSEMADKMKTLLHLSDVDLGKVSRVLRVILKDTVFFSKDYTRMVKRLSYVAMVQSANACEFVEIQHFLLHHNSNTVVAVVKHIPISPEKPRVHPFVSHIVHVLGPANDANVVLAQNLVEKVLYLCGNDNLHCIARLPNMYGLCS